MKRQSVSVGLADNSLSATDSFIRRRNNTSHPKKCSDRLLRNSWRSEGRTILDGISSNEEFNCVGEELFNNRVTAECISGWSERYKKQDRRR